MPGAVPATPSPEALARLLEQVAALQARTEVLEAWVAAQGQALPDPEAEPWAAAAQPEEPAVATGTVLSLLGRACLILGGAFLLRIATDTHLLPAVGGVALGLGYAWAWALAGRRSAARGQALWGAFQVGAALLVAYPLLWETTVRFQFLAPWACAAALVLSAALFTAVAMGQDLRRVGWAAVLGALATALGLMAATSAITTFCLALVLFGVAGLFLEDGPWRGLRWPMALAADAAVLAMTLLALAPGGSPELALDLRPAKVIALALALTAATLARFLYGALRRPEGVGAFQTLQTLAVLFLGLGGALRVAEAAGAGAAPLGLVTLLTGLGSYGCAFTFAGQEEDGTGAFRFLATLAFALVLAGSFLLLPPAGLALIWVGSGLAAGFMGRRTKRFSLHLHAAAFLGAGALASGLGTALMGAFLSPGPTLALFPPVAVLALAGLGAGHWLSPFPVDEVPPWPYRLPSLALGALGLLGAAALAVAACAPLAPSDAGALAALRTAALVGLAALLAGLSRFRPASPLTWLPYPLLACTVVKFLMEDMPRGRPITLFLALTLFGLALLAVPKWLRVEA